MRLAVIADTHGNLRALEAVLTDIATHAPDATVDLGDCLSGPLEAAATADLLMHHGFVTVRGNHDRQLLDRPPSAMGPSDRAAYEQLDDRHRAWLATLPVTAVVSDGGGADVLLCHGSPESDLTYLLETVSPHGMALAAPADVQARLGPTSERIILCGHTHLPRAVTTPDGRLVVNPGSVGLQAFADSTPYPHVGAAGSPHARYAMVDTGPRPRVSFVAVPYDWDAAAAAAERAGQPVFAHALATGFLPAA
jgi:putative phosphoesterase